MSIHSPEEITFIPGIVLPIAEYEGTAMPLSEIIQDDEVYTEEDLKDYNTDSRLLSIEKVPKRLGGFALADGERTIVDEDGNEIIETYARRTAAYDRGLSDEEVRQAVIRKIEAEATPGVQPKGRLGELNPQFNRRTPSL